MKPGVVVTISVLITVLVVLIAVVLLKNRRLQEGVTLTHPKTKSSYQQVRAHLNNDNWPTVPFGVAAVAPFTHAFNGSIVNNLYVARLDKHPFSQHTRLSLSEWNNGHPINPRLLNFKTKNGHVQDPRAFNFNGRPACAFTDNKRMYVGFLDDESCYYLRPVKRKLIGREKNWAPFVYNKKLCFLYKPGHVVEYDGDKPSRSYLSPPPTLPGKAEMRGGTQIVRHGDKLYTIFHVVQTSLPKLKLYWAGLLELESVPPFRACRWTRKPLWKASLVDSTQVPPTYHTSNPMRTMVTFPTHLEIDDNGNMFILAGYHDTTDQMVRLHTKDVFCLLE